MLESDFLVLGSGIAGLLAAHKLSRFGTVNLVTKKAAAESNTNYAQGGIASVTSPLDSFESHVQDTLRAGAGLCDEEAVRGIVREGPERVRELIQLGVKFSETKEALDLGLEGGHSQRRILHAGDRTGGEIEAALVRAARESPRVRFFEDHVAINLLLQSSPAETRPERNRCWGAYVLDTRTGAVERFVARYTVIATGGAGKVYLYTSNPDIATGDGLAMAYLAGVPLANMEFVQFHPTCLFHPLAKSFLVSEALRGEGGRLVTADGRRFMTEAHPDAELAPRDVVARAIDAELKRSGADCVYLDMTHKERAWLEKRFPTIYARCLSLGIDCAKQPIPVVPAAHFFCGGIATDAAGATPMPGLFAIGEAACTGLHGANRLASNSLLEGCVFAHRAAARIGALAAEERSPGAPSFAPWDPGAATPSDEAVVITQNWDEIRRLMWNYVGIVRTDKRLERASRRLEMLQGEIRQYYWSFLVTRDLIELRNIAIVADLVVRSARARRESRGLHYTLDHPEPSEAWRRDTVVSRYDEVSAR